VDIVRGDPSTPAPSGSIDGGSIGRRTVDAARGEKVSMVVARLIASEVSLRDLQPGSPLLTEQEMASQFGVGRPSVREALRLLEAQGLVSIRAGSGGGPTVRRPTGTDLGQTLSLFLQVLRVSFRDVLEASVRSGGLLAMMAADSVAAGNDELVPRLLETSGRRTGGAGSDQEFLGHATRFHDVIQLMAGNESISLFHAAVGHVLNVKTSESHHGHWHTTEREELEDEHSDIARAIRDGRSDRACRLNEQHLRRQIIYIDEVSPGMLDQVVTWT
jgi:GntR family transcriptional repressor for pyruvate dehydrogenase complex